MSTNSRPVIEISVLDIPYAQRLILAAIDLLLIVEGMDKDFGAWFEGKPSHLHGAQQAMRAILDERT